MCCIFMALPPRFRKLREMDSVEGFEPLTPADCDCSDLDGFMLNVERLMASELVALASHEELASAFLLWCRAWKQKPAASLPDDERILASFARLPLARWRKVREVALRGFVKCLDGRLYHRVLAEEALRAWDRKQAFRRKRETDSDRLRRWRSEQRGNAPTNANETRFNSQSETRFKLPIETQSETRFVAEGQVQGQVLKKERESSLSLESVPRARVNGSKIPGPPRWPDVAIVPAGIENSPKNPDEPMVNGYFLDRTFDQALHAARIDPAKIPVDQTPVIAWLKAGIHPEIIMAAIRRVVSKATNYTPKASLAYFDKPVRELWQTNPNIEEF